MSSQATVLPRVDVLRLLRLPRSASHGTLILNKNGTYRWTSTRTIKWGADGKTKQASVIVRSVDTESIAEYLHSHRWLTSRITPSWEWNQSLLELPVRARGVVVTVKPAIGEYAFCPDTASEDDMINNLECADGRLEIRHYSDTSAYHGWEEFSAREQRAIISWMLQTLKPL